MTYKPNFGNSNDYFSPNYLGHSNATRSFNKVSPRSKPTLTKWEISTADWERLSSCWKTRGRSSERTRMAHTAIGRQS